LLNESKESKFSHYDKFKINDAFSLPNKKRKFEIPHIFSEEIFRKGILFNF